MCPLFVLETITVKHKMGENPLFSILNNVQLISYHCKSFLLKYSPPSIVFWKGNSVNVNKTFLLYTFSKSWPEMVYSFC